MNFEAVGPERLVLVARDPWIAHHVSDEILSPRSIEKEPSAGRPLRISIRPPCGQKLPPAPTLAISISLDLAR